MSAVGLPWQGETRHTYPLASNNASCDGPGQLSLEAAPAKVLFLFDSGCPTLRPGLWRSADEGKKWEPVAVAAPPGGWLSQES